MNPWGEERADLRAAIGHSILANVNRDPKKTGAFEAYDFMPYSERPKKESIPMDEQGWNDFKSMMIAMGKPKNIDH